MALETLPDNANPDLVDSEKCVTIIFNPISGQGDPEERKRIIEEALAVHGYQSQHLITSKEKGARQHAEEALREGATLLAVSGGDGTVVEAMSALQGTDIPIALFPAGTGNLLAVNLGLSKEVPEAVHAALFGEKRSLDLARMDVDSSDDPAERTRYFAIVAGVGYDARIIHDADRETKKRLGLLAYFFAALKNIRHRPMRVKIRLDNAPHILRRRARSVMIANMGKLQGGVEMVPDADPNDGMLNIAILKAETLGEWVRLVWSAMRHTLRDDPAFEYHACRRVEVRLSHPQPMQFDGEELKKPGRRLVAEVIPNAVQVMVPKEGRSSP